MLLSIITSAVKASPVFTFGLDREILTFTSADCGAVIVDVGTGENGAVGVNTDCDGDGVFDGAVVAEEVLQPTMVNTMAMRHTTVNSSHLSILVARTYSP
jgi:hypothetical protein